MKYRINYSPLENMITYGDEVNQYISQKYLKSNIGQKQLLLKWRSLYGRWVNLEHAVNFEKTSKIKELATQSLGEIK